MKTKEINTVIDKLTEKLGVGSEKLIDAYKGEAKVYSITYWFYIIVAIIFFIIGVGLLLLAPSMVEIKSHPYYPEEVMSFYGWVSTIIGGFITLASAVSLIGQVSEFDTYITSKKFPETYAVTSIMDKIFDK